MRRAALLLACLGLVLAGPAAAAGRRVAILIDTSGSMVMMDPQRYTVQLSQIVADLNIDMIGRNWKDTIVVIGKEHSDLGTTLDRVNRAHPELGMNAINDLWPEENFYFRSDHYNFARKGVPVLFFFNGTHPDYHGPDDEPDRIDAEKEARIVRLVYLITQDVGNAAQKPAWNPASYKKIVRP